MTGTNGKTTTVRMIAHILKLMGRRVGMTSTDGIVIDGRLIKKGDMSGPKSAQMVLQNPTVDTAVFEVARGGILREGLGYDRNDVAVVTNVTGDHLGLGGIDSIGQLANVKGGRRRGGARAPGTAVLNADDPHVARMGRHCAGRVVYFTMATEKGQDGYDRVDGHLGRGGAAFCLEPSAQGELIVLRLGARTMPVLYTHLIPATFGGRARMNVANALGAAAAAWASGAHLHDIRQGLRTFSTSFFQAPGTAQPPRRRRGPGRHRLLPQRRRDAPAGRLRRADGQRAGARPAAASGATSRATPPAAEDRRHRTGRAIGVIGIPGDRRDDDQRDYGAIAATAFDEIIVREDRNLRGRAPGETRRQRRGTGCESARADGSARTTRADKILDEMTAVRTALRRAAAGRPRRDVRRRRGRGLPRGDGLGPDRRAARPPSPTPASSRRPRADPPVGPGLVGRSAGAASRVRAATIRMIPIDLQQR